MGVGTFKVGQRFELDGLRHHITRLLDDDRVEFENSESARRQELGMAELLSHFKEGRLQFRAVAETKTNERAMTRVMSRTLLTTVTPPQRELATLRLHFVKRLTGVVTTRAVLKPMIESIYAALGKPERELMPAVPHASTVTRWLQQYRESNESINALLDRHALKGNRDSRLHQDVDDLVEQCIHDLYLTPERRNMTTVLEAINQHIDLSNLSRIRSEHLPHVGMSCLKTRIGELNAYDVWAARYGMRAAQVKFRATGQGAQATLPLDRASIDHCRLDVFVVDEDTGLPLGRPWLTVILDECTRIILGYSLSFDEPSALTVMRAFRHAMLPKGEEADLRNPWPAWGVIRTLVVDNGLEFHGFSLDHAAGQFGTTVQTCPRRKPWYKGKIERYFRTMQSDLISEMPGRTFSNILEKGEYDSAKHAVISLRTLNLVLKIWTVDYYHQRRHTTLGETPSAKWSRLIGQVDRHLPDSAQWVDAAFGKPDTRMLGHQGVQFDSLFYNGDELAALRHRHGDRFSVAIVTNDEDVGYLYVVCPDSGDYIKVYATDSSYARGMTRWQHRKCREYASTLGEESQNDISLAHAKRRIRELIATDMALNPRKSRRKQGRFLDGQDPLGTPPTMSSSKPKSESHPAPQASASTAVATHQSGQQDRTSPTSPSISTLLESDDELMDLTAGTANQFKKEAFA